MRDALDELDDFELTPLDTRPPARQRYEAVLEAARRCVAAPEHVYINSTYGRGLPRWVEQRAGAYERGEMAEAIVLVPGRFDTQWYRRLSGFHLPVCLVHGRLQFSEAHTSGAPFPSAIFYLGARPGHFCRCFAAVGPLYRVVRHAADFGPPGWAAGP